MTRSFVSFWYCSHTLTAPVQGGGVVGGFDRVVSIEMFEHMKNYERLFQRVASWLNPNGTHTRNTQHSTAHHSTVFLLPCGLISGKVFVHIFSHVSYPYHFEDGDKNWMTKYFFSGGTMPSDDLVLYFSVSRLCGRRWLC